MCLRPSRLLSAILSLSLAAASTRAHSQATPLYPNYPSEIPAAFQQPTTGMDYARRDVMIPMRDGVKLHTILLVPTVPRTPASS